MFRPLGLLLAAAVACLPLAPLEHVHERQEQGSAHLLVHSHAEPHAFLPHDHHPDSEFDHDDEPVLTLSPEPGLPASVTAIVVPPASIALFSPSAAPELHRAADYVERLIHGPPKVPLGLRAPPASPRL